MSVTASNQRGLGILRAGTKAFIDDDPVEIVLIPSQGVKVEVPGGGYDYAPAAPRAAQRFKVINQTSDGSAKSESESGIVASNRDYVLLGEYNAVAEVGDTWNDGNNRYRVVELLVENGYERKWRVTSLGPEPNYG